MDHDEYLGALQHLVELPSQDDDEYARTRSRSVARALRTVTA